jgi:choline dehydrogenase
MTFIEHIFIETLFFTGVIVRRDYSPDKEEFISGLEMILSAGTIGNPQLLLLSGIGHRNQLEKHQIPLIVDLTGVEKNLQDLIFITKHKHFHFGI